MELNRHHYFMLGMVILLLGLQFRWVHTYVLSEKTTTFIASKIAKSDEPSAEDPSQAKVDATATRIPREIRPPRWLGFSLLSVGAILILHALAMPRPG